MLSYMTASLNFNNNKFSTSTVLWDFSLPGSYFPFCDSLVMDMNSTWRRKFKNPLTKLFRKFSCIKNNKNPRRQSLKNWRAHRRRRSRLPTSVHANRRANEYIYAVMYKGQPTYTPENKKQTIRPVKTHTNMCVGRRRGLVLEVSKGRGDDDDDDNDVSSRPAPLSNAIHLSVEQQQRDQV